MSKNEYGTDVDTAVSELQIHVEDSVNFIFSEFEDEWAKAERYYAGMSDLPEYSGRSTVVKTETRDTIRALKPSIMRTLLHAREIVEYKPSHVRSAALLEQQGEYVTQLFWKNGGYLQLLAATDESMKKRIGPMKTYWEEDPLPEYMKFTGITEADLKALEAAEDIDVESVEKAEVIAGVQTLDVEAYKYYKNGRIRMEAFPSYEFFINRNATCIEDAVVHGHRRTATVEEAIEMGLDYENWLNLDNDDPEQNEHTGSSWARRGYQKHGRDDFQSEDLLKHNFLLTECYCMYDLKGEGRPQKYLFWFGGTSYTYLDHEEVDEWCIDLVQIDPVGFTPFGRSIANLTMNEQDTETSLLRATVDNAHMANNPRFAANPMLTDFNDLMNNGIGAPIKDKSGGAIQVVDIPFTGQALMPLLQYLEMDTQTKVGVTKAAQGLDPDAMQSTDKEAVKNTIMLAQGQTELIVRNIIETALIPVFKKLLKLSVRHMDRVQVMQHRGEIIAVDTMLFNSDLMAEPKLGLGTTSPEMRMSALQFVLAKQEETLAKFGLDNPFTSLDMVYNTIQDLVELSGLSNVGRYFKPVTPEIEQKLAQQRAEEMERAKKEGQDAAPMDPSKALMLIEGGKAQIKEKEISAEVAVDMKRLELDARKAEAEDDYKRDKMAQESILAQAKLQEEGRAARAQDRIQREQARERKKVINTKEANGADGSDGGQAPSQSSAQPQT